MSAANLFFVVLGGALGALLRYAVSEWVSTAVGALFPWGTLAANLTGCLLIGFLWAASEEVPFSSAARLFVLTGALGAFTTFSTYGLRASICFVTAT